MTKITMMGTGNALATKCYNTCFVMDNGKDKLLVDAGGGNGILTRLEQAHISAGDIHDIYITHAHTDHLLGAIWMVRVFIQRHLNATYQGHLNVWSHEKVLRILDFNLRNMLTARQYKEIGNCVFFHEVKAGDEIDCASFHLQVFDILSTKERQFGFITVIDGKRIACLGDEPVHPDNETLVSKADYLMCEAFCLYADRDRFHPYEKHHSTVQDAARLAERLGVPNLILYHTEDKTLPVRKQTYTAEAVANYHGRVFVPDDLEEIEI